MKALVTGASGFLGRHVVDALLARGHGVRALVRPSAQLDSQWPAAVEVVRGDLCVARDLESAFEGIDTLVHLAAVVNASAEEQHASTVVASERLLDAMTRTSCRRVTLVSSFAVYDWSAIRGTLDEGSPLEAPPDLDERGGYAIAKGLQERLTRRYAEEHGWQLTVLRPGVIWGRDHGYVAALGQKVGRVHLVIGPLTRVPLTHVENCAHLCAIAADDPRAVGQTFNVVDGPGERAWVFLGHHLQRTGEKAIRIPVPYHAMWLLIRFAFATVFRRSRNPPNLLVPCRFEARLKPLRYTNAHAREALGWQPPLSFAECLDRTYGSSPRE